MAALNKVIMIGNLGKDPETRFLPDGKAVTNFSIAITESWKDKASGEKKENTEWVRIVTFGKLAEICGEYLKKGSSCYVEGKLRTRKWTDKEGVERYTTEVNADTMQMFGRPATSDTKPQASSATRTPAPKDGGMDIDSDIPF